MRRVQSILMTTILIQTCLVWGQGTKSKEGISSAYGKIPITVTAFEDKAALSGGDGCGWRWSVATDELGDAFKDDLIEKLASTGRFQILEREHINRIYDNEFQLVNSENAKKNPRGRFQVARYTLAGVVTAFDWCPQSGGGASLDIGGLVGIPSLAVSPHTSKAHVKVNVRLIDVETGEILYTSTGEGERTRTGVSVGVDAGIINFRAGGFKNSPLGEAIQDAINHAADQVIAHIPAT